MKTLNRHNEINNSKVFNNLVHNMNITIVSNQELSLNNICFSIKN